MHRPRISLVALVVALAVTAFPAVANAQVTELLEDTLDTVTRPVTQKPGGCENAGAAPTASTMAAARAATLCLLNRERTQRGLRTLRSHGTLRQVATKYSRQMVRQRFFDHVSPGGSTLTSRIKKTSYLRGTRAWSLGENLAWGTGHYATPRETVQSWMESPGHKRNILDPSFTEIGIGIALGAPVAAVASSSAATYTTEFGRRVL